MYKWGSSHLPVLPDFLFWTIWRLWRWATQSKELKDARAEFYKAIQKTVEIEKLNNRYPEDENLKQALESARDEAMVAMRKLRAVVYEYLN